MDQEECCINMMTTMYPYLASLRRNQLCQLLIQTSSLQNWETTHFHCFSTHFVELCYHSPRKSQPLCSQVQAKLLTK